MSRDFDPREYDTRERHDGIRDREDEWLIIGPYHDLAAPRDESNDHDARERDDGRGMGTFRFPKVHPAEISKEWLAKLRFSSAGGHLLYAARARSA